MKYIHIYNTREEYAAAHKEEYDMSLIVEEDNYVVFKRPKTFAEQYFTIESLEDNNAISMQNIGCEVCPSLNYSLNDGGTWTSMTITQGSTTSIATIDAGEKILFKGTNDALSLSWEFYNKFVSTGDFKTYGNILSLLYNDSFFSYDAFPGGSTNNFSGLFRSSNVTDASNLILVPLTCVSSCYNGMFRECAKLAAGPELPATVSAADCYSSLFEGCISLLEAPEVNLTTVTSNCCARMFCMDRNSKIMTPKLTKGPVLRPQTGATNCYREMFAGNGNLTEVTCLLKSAFQCTNWLKNCPETGVFKKDPSATGWPSSVSGIPSGWTVENYVE